MVTMIDAHDRAYYFPSARPINVMVANSPPEARSRGLAPDVWLNPEDDSQLHIVDENNEWLEVELGYLLEVVTGNDEVWGKIEGGFSKKPCVKLDGYVMPDDIRVIDTLLGVLALTKALGGSD